MTQVTTQQSVIAGYSVYLATIVNNTFSQSNHIIFCSLTKVYFCLLPAVCCLLPAVCCDLCPPPPPANTAVINDGAAVRQFIACVIQSAGRRGAGRGARGGKPGLETAFSG